jgi:glucans biosynthesis protein
MGTEVSYRLHWEVEPLDLTLARAIATRSGQSINPMRREFVIDYRANGPVPDDLELVVSTSSGSVIDPRGQKTLPDDRYRVSFELEPENDVAELRAVLMSNGKPWSETWLYRWTR